MGARWLKLDVGILRDVKVMKIRRMENGDTMFACWIGLMCHAMEHGSDIVEIADGVPADVSDVALICDVDESDASRALEIFEHLKMIELDESGAIRITKLSAHQSIDQYNKKREQAAERQRRRRAQSVVEKQEPVPAPRRRNPAKEKNEETAIPHSECIEVEKAWDAAYMKESKGEKYVRDKRTLFRDRELLSPLIKAHGVDTVKKRIAAYFDQPAKYNLRTVPKFCERYNGITATAPPPSDYSDWDDFDTGGDKCEA